MLTRSCFLLTLAVAAACDRRAADVAEVSGGAAPFGNMRGVHLGMTARELAQVRPAARPAGYTGYVETVNGFSVAYRIPGSYSDEQVVPPSERVRAVSAARNLAGIDSGMAEWRRIVQIASVRLKSPPVCTRIDVGTGGVGLEAEWRLPGSSFSATLFEVPQTRGEAYRVSLRLGVGRKLRHVGDPGRSRADCNADPSGMWRGRPQ